MADSPHLELVKHLRTVHFAVVIASVALLLPILSNPQRPRLEELQNVQSDLDGIVWAKEVIEQNWIADHVPNIDRAKDEFVGLWEVEGNFPDKSTQYVWIEPDHSLFSMRKSKGAKAPLSDLSPRINTLGEWRNFWNEIGSAHACVITEMKSDAGFALVPPEHKVENLVVRRPLKDEKAGEAYILELTLKTRYLAASSLKATHMLTNSSGSGGFRIRDLETNVESYSLQDESPTFILPVNCDDHRLGLQRVLAEQVSPKWTTGTYAETFSNLHSHTKNLLTADLKVVKTHIEEQIGLERELVKAFGSPNPRFLGVELSSGSLVKWSLVFLVAIQIYYYLHLSTFRRRRLYKDDEVRKFPWIGVYRNRWAQLVFLVSSVLLPLGTVLIVSLWDRSWEQAPLLSFLLLAELLIVSATWVTVAGLRRHN